MSNYSANFFKLIYHTKTYNREEPQLHKFEEKQNKLLVLAKRLSRSLPHEQFPTALISIFLRLSLS